MNSLINQSTVSNDVIRPTLVEVNLLRLKNNFQTIKKFVTPAKIMPILKANAYGHGLVRTAQFMEEIGADMIGVAVLEEGILLRKSGIKMPILVLGGILGNQVPHFLNHNLTLTASSISKLNQIEEAARHAKKTAKVHLKIDTGMERIGVHYYSANPFLEKALKCKHIEIEGIFSHFASSESTNLDYANLQLERFMEVVTFFEKQSMKMPLRHMANSGAILQMPDAHLDMIRPGILLYGVYPDSQIEKKLDIKPALSWKSRVVYFKVIKPGHPVGYGSSWQSETAVRAVTVPVGYGDGYFRSMSDKAKVILGNKQYPVIGTISMDQIVVNINQDSAYNNDDVILIGEGENTAITCEDMARWAGTIPYEILTNINTRVPRVYL